MKIKANIHDAVCNPTKPWPDLIVDKSDIEGAGNGLFSNKFIPKGRPICEYKGDILSNEQVNALGIENQFYILALGDPPMLDLGGKVLTTINADPEKAKEIGFGGFANDLHTKYPEEIIKAMDKASSLGKAFREKLGTFIHSLDFNKKLSHKNRKTLRKEMKKVARAEAGVTASYASNGYNATYIRIEGLPCFMLMSIKEIYPGDEIYVPY